MAGHQSFIKICHECFSTSVLFPGERQLSKGLSKGNSIIHHLLMGYFFTNFQRTPANRNDRSEEWIPQIGAETQDGMATAYLGDEFRGLAGSEYGGVRVNPATQDNRRRTRG